MSPRNFHAIVRVTVYIAGISSNPTADFFLHEDINPVNFNSRDILTLRIEFLFARKMRGKCKGEGTLATFFPRHRRNSEAQCESLDRFA